MLKDRVSYFVLTLLMTALPLTAFAQATAPSIDSLISQVSTQHPEIPAAALQKATSYFDANGDAIKNKEVMTIIDFNQPSTAKRMFVIDLHTGAVSTYFVAHGKNSGDNYATQFSNQNDSFMSSLGIYLTGAPYVGSHGLSMRLSGEENTNSNAFARDIVMHGASYVSQQFIQQNGRLGRSEGCPAVEIQYATPLVNQLANGSVYLIYK